MYIIFMGFFISLNVFAETPSTIVTGAIVNSWNQAGFQATDKLFDLAIQGNGFFALQLANGERVFSRQGELSLNSEGFLIHNASQGKVLGYCNEVLEPINLSLFAQDLKGTTVKSFRTALNGVITAFYESGYAHQTCTVGLALFNNPNRLIRDNHTLIANRESGMALIGLPQQQARGSVYAYTLEELDEYIYQKNIKSRESHSQL
jgi:flagellar hook protein FlgE